MSIAPNSAQAQFAEGPEKGRYSVHIFNVNPGPELFTRFGHIAVLVEDRKHNRKTVYNYGTFDFTDPALKWKYARGFLTFWLELVPYRIVPQFYVSQDRTITIRTLGLTEEQAELMVQKMNVNALPENREYAYRHYIDNCSTRIRDLLDEILGGALKKEFYNKQTGRTYRYWTREAVKGMPVLGWTILFSLGPIIDHPITRWDEEFLPEILAEDLDAIRVGPDQKPLVIEKTVVYKSQGPPAGTVIETWEWMTVTVLIALLVLGLGLPSLLGTRKGSRRLFGAGLALYGLFSGLSGLMLVLYWTATAHTDTHYNENLLIMPFLNIWLLKPGFRLLFKGELKATTVKFLRKYIFFGLGLIALDILLKIGPFIQDNWGAILWATPCYLAVLAALYRTGLIVQDTDGKRAKRDSSALKKNSKQS